MRPASVSVTAPAKINLCLGVGPVRDDGYHALATVYQAVGLYDQVTVSPADSITVTVRGHERLSIDEVPTDASNIAVRAAELLACHHRLDTGADIVIEKGIPVAGGMAGGSADAAASLVACDALWGTRTPREELMDLASELGSDVPFALVGGTAIGSGHGEIVTPLMTRGEYWWVVLEAREGLSTPAVYGVFDTMHAGSAVADPEIPDDLIQALRTNDVERLGASLVNDLQAAALRLRPELADALALGLAGSAHGAILSGSGPSCLFLCEGRAHAMQVADGLRELGPVSFALGPVPGARVTSMAR